MNEANRKWWTLGAMCFALFMVMLDNTVVNIALPAIKHSFGASISGLSWTVNAYTLVFGVLLVTGGRLGDVFGRKRMFLGGLIVFTLGSIGAGLSGSINELVAFRGVQGAGAAFLMPGIAVDPHAHLQRQGSGPRARPVGRHLRPGPGNGPGRRRPAGREGRLGVDLLPQRPGRPHRRAADALGRARVARRDRHPARRRARHPHACRSAWAGSCSGLVQANDYGWTSGRILTEFAVGVVSLAAFIVLQLRGRDPMLNMDVLPQPHVQRGQRDRVPGHVLDVRDVLLHHALHAERRGALAAPDRRALPAHDRPDHRHGAGGRAG